MASIKKVDMEENQSHLPFLI